MAYECIITRGKECDGCCECYPESIDSTEESQENICKNKIQIKLRSETMEKGQKCIVRTYSAGVFYGTLENREGKEVILLNAIRIWRWYGAASLSQLAMEGTKDPVNCNFAVPVTKIILTEAIEIIEVTPNASVSIEGVPSWKIK